MDNSKANSQSSDDIAIIGGGVAGLTSALHLADRGHQVSVFAKRRLVEGSSLYAQGGIAAVEDNNDSIQSHIDDTLRAGAGLCHFDAVEKVVSGGPRVIQWLVDQGVQFTESAQATNDNQLHLTKEGGHSHRRVVHAKDATGKAVIEILAQKCDEHANIQLFHDYLAVDLITSNKIGHTGINQCCGFYALDITKNIVVAISARAVILATGGASKAYLYTSNPDTSTGDGIAMAWRAGCQVANMEFIQFHPTCLYHPHAKSFLISEAVRGEGGKLVLPDGQRFMLDHDPRGELASRDIVARAIDYEMKKRGLDSVYLDISHKSRDFIQCHFPTIMKQCQHYGFDMAEQAIPVVPAAHYTCGGIVTGLHGDTNLSGLYAVGECASTGLHGANRLASNSLLECLVFAEAASKHIDKNGRGSERQEAFKLPAWDESRVSDPDEQIVVSHNWDELRRFMWDYVGIVRSDKRLQRALRRVELLKEEIRDYYSNFKINNDLIELRNLVVVSELIIRCALARKESRGLHYSIDYPDVSKDNEGQDTII